VNDGRAPAAARRRFPLLLRAFEPAPAAGLVLSAIANVFFGLSSAVVTLGLIWMLNGWKAGFIGMLGFCAASSLFFLLCWRARHHGYGTC